MSDTTPTVSELLNAANWEYQQVGNPADLTPFLVDGQQLSMTSQSDGMSGSAWLTPQDQVVVSFLGTQFVSLAALAADPAFSFRQLLEDVGVASGDVTAGEKDAAAFARQVVQAAAAQGIASSDVFLTGHSLGAIQAEYAAQQTGLGGIGFEPTGIPRSSTAAGTGANFVNVVQDGDSVGNYSSDIDAEQPFSPAYQAGGSGALPHYGYVALIGDPSAEAALKAEAALSNGGDAGVGLTAAAYAGQLAAFHLPDDQAYNLGVTLTQLAATELVGARSGPVIDAADLTIPELIQLTGASLSAAEAPSSSSASSGDDSGAAAAFLTGSNGSVASAVAPSIIGAATALTIAGAETLPFAHVTVTDANPGATDTLIITLAGGALTDGTGFSGLRSIADGVYALSGAPAAITAELGQLRFTPGDATGTLGTAYTLINGSSAGTSAVSAGVIPSSDGSGTAGGSPQSVTIQGVSGATNLTDHVVSGVVTGFDAGSVVTVADGSALLGSATTDANGDFSVPVTYTGDGSSHAYDFTATVSAASGASATSSPVNFALDFTPNSDGFGSTTTRIDSTGGEVYALYEGLLGRAPDALGAEQWAAALDAGMSLDQATQGFLAAAEGQSRFAVGSTDDDFVNQLYQQVLGRTADASGEASWDQHLADGASRADVATAFVFSQEHAADLQPALAAGVFTPDLATSEAARLYDGLLGRAPDADGLQANAGALKGGTSLDSLAQSFIASSEYQAQGAAPTNEQFVTALYQNALGRAPEAAGGQSWIAALNGGTSRAEVAVGIAESAEAQTHLAGRIETGFQLA